jgi:hypothetical protein
MKIVENRGLALRLQEVHRLAEALKQSQAALNHSKSRIDAEVSKALSRYCRLRRLRRDQAFKNVYLKKDEEWTWTVEAHVVKFSCRFGAESGEMPLHLVYDGTLEVTIAQAEQDLVKDQDEDRDDR